MTSPEWTACAATVEAGLKELLCNQFAESEARFTAALKAEMRSAQPDISVIAVLRMGQACVSLSEGLAAGALDRLSDALPTLWQAESEAAQAAPWVGIQLVRGVTLLFGGMIQMVQQSYVKAGINITKAWALIKPASLEALDYTGTQRELVRSMGQFVLGAINLLVSTLPPSLISIVELVGFDGRREKALSFLRNCWKEDGLFGGFAALVIASFTVYVRPFFFETLSHAEKQEIEQILIWAEMKFPGSFFFAVSECNYRLVCREPALAVEALKGVPEKASSIPTLQMLLFYRRGLAKLCGFDFQGSACDFRLGAISQISAKRVSYSASLSLLEALCLKTADAKNDISESFARLEILRKEFDTKKDLWMPSDLWALRKYNEYCEISKSDQSQNPSGPFYTLDLFYGPVLCFASVAEKFPIDLKKIIPLLNLPPWADLGAQCRRKLLLAEFYRQAGKRGEALDALDAILDRADDELKDEEAIFSLALLFQSLIFAQAGESEAATEALKEMDERVAASVGVLGSWVGSRPPGTAEFDVAIKFKRQGVQQRIDAGGYQSAEEDD